MVRSYILISSRSERVKNFFSVNSAIITEDFYEDVDQYQKGGQIIEEGKN